jgi:hypothetical protein
MLNNKKYLSQLNEIEITKSELIKKEYEIKSTWSKELINFIDVNRFKNKRCYIIINNRYYFAVDSVRSCIILSEDVKSKISNNVIGGVYLRGFSFLPYSETNDTIYHTFSYEKLIRITDEIKLVSKEEFESVFENTISSLFMLTEENIEKQYKNFPYDFEHIEQYCPELNRIECKNMLKELEDKQTTEIFTEQIY